MPGSGSSTTSGTWYVIVSSHLLSLRVASPPFPYGSLLPASRSTLRHTTDNIPDYFLTSLTGLPSPDAPVHLSTGRRPLAPSRSRTRLGDPLLRSRQDPQRPTGLRHSLLPRGARYSVVHWCQLCAVRTLSRSHPRRVDGPAAEPGPSFVPPSADRGTEETSFSSALLSL